jgi:hypothetical protein
VLGDLLTTPVPAVLGAVIAVTVAVRAVGRCMLYALAVYATVKALADSDLGEREAAAAVREHRLAVVQTVLSALERRGGSAAAKATRSLHGETADRR